MVAPRKDAQSLVKESLEASLDEFIRLTDQTINLLRDEPMHFSSMLISGHLIEIPAQGETIVVGDLHGDLKTLAQILDASKFTQKVKRSEPSQMIFLGDYGDRGALSPEVFYVVMSLKVNFPEHVILLRGNHEGPEDLQASPHDLPLQLRDRFGEKSDGAYGKLQQLFSLLHNAVLVRDSCIILHGGVPSSAKSTDDVAYAHIKHPQESHLEEILWSDPQENLKGTLPSPRGAGRLFGQDVAEDFLGKMHANVLIRGHEPADTGFKINHSGLILTIFSRKGEPYYNSQAAFLQLDLSKKIKNAFQLEPFMKQLQ